MNLIKLSLLVVGSVWLSFSYGQDAWQSPLLHDHPLVGKIIEQATGNTITSEELVNHLSLYPFIFVGEKHDNPDHHVIESRLITALVDKQTTVVFEMLNNRHAPILKNLTASLSLKQLKEQLKWSKKSWPWQDYGPLMLQILQQQGALKAGNIDKDEVMAIYDQGLEPLREQERFSSVTKVEQELRVPLLKLIYESHCGKMAKEELQPMVDIQLAKDASMAFALESSETPRRLMIAGSVHTRKDIGIPQHLSRQHEGVTLLMVEVDKGKLVIQDYPSLTESQADFVWFTPKFTEEDYCSRLD